MNATKTNRPLSRKIRKIRRAVSLSQRNSETIWRTFDCQMKDDLLGKLDHFTTRVLAGVVNDHISDGYFVSNLSCIDGHFPRNICVHSISVEKNPRNWNPRTDEAPSDL